ncbi:MAG: glycoside hydrolase family 15 protein [Pyrinomonadaceae bacterium]|nr:glycoside hydrolase family 15 protein [Pyrinomonadaceae bacterium]
MRDIPVGNGSLLVNFDDKYQIRDIYFPHVGQENHTEGFPCRFGIWADSVFSWIFADGWDRTLRFVKDALVTDVTLRNDDIGIEIECRDAVADAENVLVRRVEVRDLTGSPREVRVYLHHDLRLYENKVGDTAFYDPETLALIHYKKHRYFLVNTEPHFDQFATGRKAFRNSEGTWRDAEDGDLHGGAITEGSVDSTIGLHFNIEAGGTAQFHYWIAAGTSHKEVEAINQNVLTSGPASYLTEAAARSQAWLAGGNQPKAGLSAAACELYRRSLLIVRSQIDGHGAIIAANDHDVTERATDHYSYLWPRDGAFVANALDRAGYPEFSRRFFDLCSRIVHERGYFLQKYNPDGSVGSGWHSYWDKFAKRPMYPIQEDETALVLWALWEHFSMHPDERFARQLYKGLIVRCGDFLAAFRDPATKLPSPSWNLWEDRRGVHTFTCATVVAGLRAAASFAGLFGDGGLAEKYTAAADEVVAAMREHLYSREHGRFLRGLLANGDDSLVPDAIVDASLFGVFYFGCLEPDDEMVVSTMAAIEQKLTNQTSIGGIARFENDGYMRESDAVIGNSWFICTLWLAEYYIARARSGKNLDAAREIIEWTAAKALPSGVLGEQIEPVSGRHTSVSPLTWSHSTYVAAVLSYSRKFNSFV